MGISWGQWLRGSNRDDGTEPDTECWPYRETANRTVEGLGESWCEAAYAPTDADRGAAWKLFNQLRSRVITRNLDYTQGDESTALKSIFNLFGFSRSLCEEAGQDAHRFSDLVWHLLNDEVRPFTAKWHRHFVRGRLREDERHQFREELMRLRATVAYFEQLFLAMSQADSVVLPHQVAAESPPVASSRPDFPFDRIVFSESVDTDTAKKIHRDEQSALCQRRQLPESEPINGVTGLALSGGGLRSATFALGALQGLSKRGVLGDFDFLSTVSGGGYAGSFLSCYLNTPPEEGVPPIGTDSDQLPFQRSEGQESAPMRHLRASSKSLLAGGFWRKLEIPVLAALGWMTSLAVALPPLVLLTLAACSTNRDAISRALAGKSPYDGWNDRFLPLILSAAAWTIGLCVVGYWQHRQRRRGTSAALPSTLIGVVGCLLLLTLVLCGWILFPYSIGISAHGMGRAITGTTFAFPTISESAAAAITAVAIPIVSSLAKRTKKSSPLKPILSGISHVLLPLLFLWILSTLIARYAFFDWQPQYKFLTANAIGWLVASVAMLLITGLLLNVNAVSLHPFYRDRLARAYHVQQRKDGVETNVKQKLSELRVHNPTGPYHLINTALNAPAGSNGALRGRAADFYMFSSLYCGSESTGYVPTVDLEQTDPSVDLATAIAISGGAASPYMGVNDSRFSFWASLLNVRLDYWLPIPGRRRFASPGAGYWLRQYIGWVTDKSPYVNLSDGGHIENMAAYELLRRRCPYIVVVDGECDPGITCGSFLQVLRYAKIDFGIDIDIDLSRLRLANDTDEPASESPASPTVDFHFAIGQIHYPNPDGPPQSGLLLYLKSSVSGNEGTAIERYRSKEADFPHQSTADLAYDEEQFEAYRSLGQHIVEDTFREELVGRTPPKTVAEWMDRMEQTILHER